MHFFRYDEMQILFFRKSREKIQLRKNLQNDCIALRALKNVARNGMKKFFRMYRFVLTRNRMMHHIQK